MVFLGIYSLHIFRKMSSSSPQRGVRQMTGEGIATTRARMESRQVILERNIVRTDLMVAPLDFIAQMIYDNHWGYRYSCACPVYPRLVRDFYGYMEVIQDDESGIILQTTVQEHTIQNDPRFISSIIHVPVLAISMSPFTDILDPPSMENLIDFVVSFKLLVSARIICNIMCVQVRSRIHRELCWEN